MIRYILRSRYVEVMDREPILYFMTLCLSPAFLIMFGVRVWPCAVALFQHGLTAQVSFSGNRGTNVGPAWAPLATYLVMAAGVLIPLGVYTLYRRGGLRRYIENDS